MAEQQAGAGGVAIITGGASGIGLSLSKELARRGLEVVLADRQLELAEQGAAAIRDAGGRATPAELDVRDAEAFQRLADETVKRTGRIDYLFNNAGIGVGGEVDSYSRADWDDVLDVDLRGVAYGIQAVYPHMQRQHSGHIVNTASIAGLIPAPSQASYTVAKHAVVALSKVLRVEAKRHGVRVSALCPGVIRTPILTGGRYGRLNTPGNDEARVRSWWEQFRPMQADEFARGALGRVFDNEAIIIVPRWWKALWYVDRLSPALGMALAARTLERMRRHLAQRASQGPAARPLASAPRASGANGASRANGASAGNGRA